MRALMCILVLGAVVTTAQAGPFEFVRIGDVDGFGYGTGAGFFAANGGDANNDNAGVLAAGDFLPDINRSGGVVTGSHDDFDLRSAGEAAGGTFQSSGSVLVSSVTGSDFTDIALSTSYDASSAANSVLIGTGTPNTFGAGGAFPKPPSNSRPNQPGFFFDFFVATGDINPADPVFFNMVFGDYDVSPASIRITDFFGNQVVVPISVQPPGSDGLIQAAPATLNFNDVFRAVAGGWQAHVFVDFLANSEPYTAFDYVELSVDPISVLPPVIPEPGSLLLCFGGLVGLALWRRRSRT